MERLSDEPQEVPWVDVEVYELHEDLCYSAPDCKDCGLTLAPTRTDFLGYVYTLPDGREVVHGQAILWVTESRAHFGFSVHAGGFYDTPIRPDKVRLRK